MVYVLNGYRRQLSIRFATGRSPSRSTGRRLLYLAMTRAKRDLHLLAPVRFYITQQSPLGDRYVTSARSRFMSEAVLLRFERRSWPASHEDQPGGSATRGARIDVAARLKGMW